MARCGWRHWLAPQAGYAALAAGTACGVAIRPSKMTAADGGLLVLLEERVSLSRCEDVSQDV